MSKDGQPPVHRMRSMTVWCEGCGKRHQQSTPDDVALFDAIAAEVCARFDDMRVPREAIPPGFNTNQMRKYGYRYWHQMFNARQLRGLELCSAPCVKSKMRHRVSY